MSVSYCYPYMQTISEDFLINTNYFAPRDLQLFIESIETISRIKRERHERRQKRIEEKAKMCGMNTTADKTIADEPVIHMEAKKIPDYMRTYESDEAYCGSAENSPRSSVVYAMPYKATASTSDSEESGIFACGEQTQQTPSVEYTLEEEQQQEQEHHLYENIAPLRPRSEVISKPKCRSARSRIIGLVLKREYAQSPKSTVAAAERRDRVLDDVIKYQYESLSTLNSKKNKKSRRPLGCRVGSAEERFLEKALRYLTL